MNGVDPTGLVLGAVAGTGSKDDSPGSVYYFYRDYVGEKVFRNGPDNTVTGSDAAATGKDLYDQVVAYHNAYPNDPIDLIGHSRGAVVVTDVAGMLKKNGIPVRFLGLYDPVDMSGSIGCTNDQIPSNVAMAVIIRSDPMVLSRASWHRPDYAPEAPLATTVIPASVFGTHSAVGGVPWDDPTGGAKDRFRFLNIGNYANSRQANALTEKGAAEKADEFMRLFANAKGLPITSVDPADYGLRLINDAEWKKMTMIQKATINSGASAAMGRSLPAKKRCLNKGDFFPDKSFPGDGTALA
jgi:hypothetical protein